MAAQAFTFCGGKQRQPHYLKIQNYKKMRSKFSLLLVLLVILLSSCDKEENQVLSEVQSKYATESKIAKGLSLAILEDESIQKNLKSLCLKHLEVGFSDQETSVHLSFDEIVGDKDQQTLGQIINKYAQVDKSDLCKLPGLSILLEGNVDSDSFDPEIYYNNGFNDKDLNVTIPYFENGIEKSRPLSYNPSNAVFVVRISEAYESNKVSNNDKINIGKTVCGEDISITKYDLDLIDAIRNSQSGDLRCPRASNPNYESEYLEYFYTCNDHDPWAGDGEFYFIYRSTSNESKSGEYGSWKKNTGRTTNVDGGIWVGSSGDERLWVIMEADGGSLGTISVTVEGVSLTVTIKNDDDFIWSQIISFCTDLNKTYSSGGCYSLRHVRKN
jgi:uncharacterized lipoprotein YehR (DUF1307 family)